MCPTASHRFLLQLTLLHHSCVLVTLEIKSADKAQEVAQALVEYAEGYRKDQGTLDWIVTQDPKVSFFGGMQCSRAFPSARD